MNNVMTGTLVLKVGSLCFLEAKPFNLLFGKTTYYWKFADSQVYYGPFNTLFDAGQSVDDMMKGGPSPATSQVDSAPSLTENKAEEVDNKNVIQVDFKSRRRK